MTRPLLVLDVDETLIHATDRTLEVPHQFEVGRFRVHERPGLRRFVADCARLFDLAVWTSATNDYAEKVCEWIFGETPLVFLWTRDRCTRRLDSETQEHYWLKDLAKVKRLGHDLRRVLVVEDLPRNLERQYGNLITVKPFVGDPDDRELPALAEYLATLADVEDLRTVEKRGWRKDRSC